MKKLISQLRRRKMDAKTLVESIVTGDEEAGQYFTANMSSRIAERLEVLKVAAASQLMSEEVEQIDELSANRLTAAGLKSIGRGIRAAANLRGTLAKNRLRSGLAMLGAAERRNLDARINAKRAGDTEALSVSGAQARKAGLATKRFTKQSGERIEISQPKPGPKQLKLALEKMNYDGLDEGVLGALLASKVKESLRDIKSGIGAEVQKHQNARRTKAVLNYNNRFPIEGSPGSPERKEFLNNVGKFKDRLHPALQQNLKDKGLTEEQINELWPWIGSAIGTAAGTLGRAALAGLLTGVGSKGMELFGAKNNNKRDVGGDEEGHVVIDKATGKKVRAFYGNTSKEDAKAHARTGNYRVDRINEADMSVPQELGLMGVSGAQRSLTLSALQNLQRANGNINKLSQAHREAVLNYFKQTGGLHTAAGQTVARRALARKKNKK